MTPLLDRKQAKESGFAQVREALQKFEGTVGSAEFGQWGGELIDEETGKTRPPKEFLEVTCTEVEVLEVTEELSMEIDEWNFRVNCSDFNGSFWVERFLESVDKHKLLIPEGLVGKRIVWTRVILEAVNKNGERQPKYDSTNFIIESVKAVAKAAPKISPKVTAAPAQAEAEEVPTEDTPNAVDPMEAALTLAVGKTEAQFRTAVALDPQFTNSPLLSMAKAGIVTQSLVTEGKLVVVKEGNKEVYQLPE